MIFKIENFKKGDKVEVINGYEDATSGLIGTIVKMIDERVALVDFGKDLGFTHDGGGMLLDDTGYKIPLSYLKKIEKQEKKQFKLIDFKPGTRIADYVKKLIKIEKDKDRLKWLRTFDNCVLPEKVTNIINEALTIVMRADMFEKWGLNEQFEKGLTNSILIYGASGTGKTMVSESIAAILGKNLMKLDSGSIQSSLPGQTERNIKESFQKAKHEDCVLLLDECDSLLYNRNAVGMIMASEINALLSEIENFDGIVILTTNRLHKLDEALQRRIIAKIELPLPNEKARIEIWKKLIPSKMPIDKNVDFNELSEVVISGGEIKNAIILAARKAIAQNENKVDMKHFRDAIVHILEAKEDYQNSQPKKVEEMLE